MVNLAGDSHHITQKRDQLVAQIKAILEQLRPHGIILDKDSRKRTLRPCRAAEAHTQRVHDLAVKHGVSLRNISLDGTAADIELAKQFQPIEDELRTVLTLAEDTGTQAGSEAWYGVFIVDGGAEPRVRSRDRIRDRLHGHRAAAEERRPRCERAGARVLTAGWPPLRRDSAPGHSGGGGRDGLGGGGVRAWRSTDDSVLGADEEWDAGAGSRREHADANGALGGQWTSTRCHPPVSCGSDCLCGSNARAGTGYMEYGRDLLTGIWNMAVV